MSTQSLKSGWKMVKFGEVVKNANLVERDPEANGVEKIVGLKHIDPENLHIRRWNSVADGTSFTRKFVPGQTLFGKRRAYQRKVAYAEFEGICSGDILTFEPKNRKVLLPELLSFICQSDAFFDHALGTSAGSLSPRTSWRALQDFEFPLPPLDEQKRFTEILWAADEAQESYSHALYQAEYALGSVRDKILSGDLALLKNFGVEWGKSTDWMTVSVEDVVKFQGGSQPPRDTFEYQSREGVIRLVQIRDYKSDEFITYIPTDLARRFCDETDVMIGRYGPPIFQILRGIKGAYNVALIKAVPNEERLSKDYLFWFLKQQKLFEAINHLSRRSSGQTGIDMDFLKKYSLSLPPVKVQQLIVNLFDSFEKSRCSSKIIANGTCNSRSATSRRA